MSEYKDYKGHFKIIIDDMPSKSVCYLIINQYKKSINVKGKEYSLSNISSREITRHRSLIVNEAIKYLK